MSFINDEVFDQGLDYADTFASAQLDICSTDPGGTYATVTANLLGTKTSYSIGATQDGAQDGRRVVGASFSDGTVSNTGNASHWAITNGVDTVLASGSLTTPQTVTATNTFSLDAISITLRDPA